MMYMKAKVLEKGKQNKRCDMNNTFENYVVAKNNQFAWAAAKFVAESPGSMCNPLFLYGIQESGKAHLLHAIEERLRSANSNWKIKYVHANEFCDEIKALYSGERDPARTETTFFKRYYLLDVFIIEDFHLIEADKRAYEVLYHIMSTLRNNNKQIVLSSINRPKDTDNMHHRMMSLIDRGMTAELTGPDYEVREAIRRKKEQENGVKEEDAIRHTELYHITAVGKQEWSGLFEELVRLHEKKSLSWGDLISRIDLRNKHVAADDHIKWLWPEIGVYDIRKENERWILDLGMRFPKIALDDISSMDRFFVKDGADFLGTFADEILTIEEIEDHVYLKDGELECGKQLRRDVAFEYKTKDELIIDVDLYPMRIVLWDMLLFVRENDDIAFEEQVKKQPRVDEEDDGAVTEDAYEKLQKMVGLTEVKNRVDQIISAYSIRALRKKAGINDDKASLHMVFTGNPGSAKTTVARLLAGILKARGILNTGVYVECGRADFVARYVGWTAKTVKEKFEKARGGVLFIDEAYSLVDGSASYGDEAINTIVQEMENNRDDVIVIFAGYPEKMKDFIERNEELKSRIVFHLDFPDYKTDELMGILKLMSEERGYKLDPTAEKRCRKIFDDACHNTDFGNGRFVRNIFEQATLMQAQRLYAGIEEKEPDVESLQLLKAEDFDKINLALLYCNDSKKVVGF